MTEREGVAPPESWRYGANERPLDRVAPPPVSGPTTDERRPPADGVDIIELTRVFAVLGLLGLALVLFFVLMVVLRLTVF